MLQRHPVHLPADARPEPHERRCFHRRLDGTTRRRLPGRGARRRIRTIERQTEIQARVRRECAGLQPLELAGNVFREREPGAGKDVGFRSRRALDVRGNRVDGGDVTFAFRAGRQCGNQRTGAVERFRRIDGQLTLPGRDQQFGLEQPRDDERPRAPHRNPLVNGAGFDQAVVTALEHQSVGFAEIHLILLADRRRSTADRHHHRRQPEPPPHATIGHLRGPRRSVATSKAIPGSDSR